MRLLSITVAAGAVVFGLATSCFAGGGAYVFSPPGSFTASGDVTVTTPSSGSLDCTVNASGSSQTREVTSVTFSGATGCSNFQAANLPWKLIPQSTHSLHIHKLALVTPSGVCGHNEVFAKLNNGALQIKDLLPGRNGQVCKIDGSLTTSPALTIIRQ